MDCKAFMSKRATGSPRLIRLISQEKKKGRGIRREKRKKRDKGGKKSFIRFPGRRSRPLALRIRSGSPEIGVTTVGLGEGRGGRGKRKEKKEKRKGKGEEVSVPLLDDGRGSCE